MRSSLNFHCVSEHPPPCFAGEGFLNSSFTNARRGIRDTPSIVIQSDVAVFPDEIVEGAEIEFLALLDVRFGQEFDNLEFADLVLPSGIRTKFLSRGMRCGTETPCCRASRN